MPLENTSLDATTKADSFEADIIQFNPSPDGGFFNAAKHVAEKKISSLKSVSERSKLSREIEKCRNAEEKILTDYFYTVPESASGGFVRIDLDNDDIRKEFIKMQPLVLQLIKIRYINQDELLENMIRLLSQAMKRGKERLP